jgi:trypsin
MASAIRACVCVLLAAIITACGGSGGDGGTESLACPRIAGGTQCGGTSAVVQVLIESTEGTSACSATMITPQKALTAGHCFFGKAITRAAIVAGEAGFRIASVAIHPQYRGVIGQDSDLAVISTESPVPVPTLPVLVDDLYELVAVPGTVVQAVGYGLTESGTVGELKAADMIITGTDRREYLFFAQPLDGGAPGSTCAGDSGGPAVYRSTQDGTEGVLGVVSYGPIGCQPQSTTAFVTLHDSSIYNWLFTAGAGAQFR